MGPPGSGEERNFRTLQLQSGGGSAGPALNCVQPMPYDCALFSLVGEVRALGKQTCIACTCSRPPTSTSSLRAILITHSSSTSTPIAQLSQQSSSTASRSTTNKKSINAIKNPKIFIQPITAIDCRPRSRFFWGSACWWTGFLRTGWRFRASRFSDVLLSKSEPTAIIVKLFQSTKTVSAITNKIHHKRSTLLSRFALWFFVPHP